MTTDTTVTEKNKAQKESSSVQSQPSPKETPQTYTQEEVDRIIQIDRVEQGRKHKATQVERDHFKAQFETKESELTDLKDEIAKLEKHIDDLSSSDPELKNLEKMAKALREQERALKEQVHQLEADKSIHSQALTEAQEIDQLITVYQVAGEYGNADELADKLMDLCETVGATDEDKIRSVAKALWGEVPLSPNVKSFKPYSGITSGGRSFTRDKNNPTETLKQAFRNLQQRR